MGDGSRRCETLSFTIAFIMIALWIEKKKPKKKNYRRPTTVRVYYYTAVTRHYSHPSCVRGVSNIVRIIAVYGSIVIIDTYTNSKKTMCHEMEMGSVSIAAAHETKQTGHVKIIHIGKHNTADDDCNQIIEMISIICCSRLTI